MKCWMRRNFNTGIWTIVYITESGYEGEVEVSAVNKIMALDIFEDMAKDFDEKVVSADCFLVEGY